MIVEWKSVSEEQLKIVRSFQQSAPVQVGKIAKELGLGVKSATLKPGISGEIMPSHGHQAGFVIRINRHEVHHRQRFTVAHEIAHFLLHREHIGSGVSDNTLYRSSLSDTRERQANRLAADILMPWHLVEKEIEREQLSPKELAERLGVSETAIKIRLGIPT